eukprot:g72859.t1
MAGGSPCRWICMGELIDAGLEGKSTHGRTRMCLTFLSTHPGRGKLFQEEALIFRFRRCSWWTRTATLHQAVVGGALISSSCSTQR